MTTRALQAIAMSGFLERGGAESTVHGLSAPAGSSRRQVGSAMFWNSSALIGAFREPSRKIGKSIVYARISPGCTVVRTTLKLSAGASI